MFLIAEIGINHNGCMATVKKMIKTAKNCGADAVKFQKRTIDVVYTQKYLDSFRDSPWGTMQRDQKNGLEFGELEYQEIDEICKEYEIPWLASAWDLPSLQFIESFHPFYHKVASPMVTNLPFIEAVAALGEKTFLSTGMSALNEIDQAVGIFRRHSCPFVLMHCVSKYPCKDSECNLQMIKTLQERYPGVEIGYSGHETGIQPTLAAYTLGATTIERHFTLDRSMYGSDQAASIEPTGLWRIAEYGRQIDSAMGTGRKNILPEEHENAVKMRYWL